MMKNKIKQEKGVTLTILVITVITLMIITGTLIYNVEDSTRIKKLTNLYSDIDLLRTKVTDYYFFICFSSIFSFLFLFLLFCVTSHSP